MAKMTKLPKGFESSKYDRDPKGTKEGSKADMKRDMAEAKAFLKSKSKKMGKGK